jgi:hypothetical protein
MATALAFRRYCFRGGLGDLATITNGELPMPPDSQRNNVQRIAALMASSLPAVLTRDEVAEFLQVQPRQIDRLGVPSIDLGKKTKRYLARDVLEWLEERRTGPSRRRSRRDSEGGFVEGHP